MIIVIIVIMIWPLLEYRGSRSSSAEAQFLLWSAYFGQSDSAALGSSGVTCWALMLSDTPPLLYEAQCVSNSACNLGQSASWLFHNNKWQWLDMSVWLTEITCNAVQG